MAVRVFARAEDFEISLTEPIRSYESRGSATMALLFDADSRGWLCRPLDAFIAVTDRNDSAATFSYSGGAADEARLVPAFVFYDWPEVHIFSYAATIRALVRASKAPPTVDKLFWAGAVDTNPFRAEAAEWANGRADVEFRVVAWDRTDPAHL